MNFSLHSRDASGIEWLLFEQPRLFQTIADHRPRSRLRLGAGGDLSILNAYWKPLDFELPRPGTGGAAQWRRWIDTGLESPNDIVSWHDAVSVSERAYPAHPRSVIVLLGERVLTEE